MAVKVQMRRRITFVLIAIFILFAAVVGKLAYVQFVQGSDLQQEAENLRTRNVAVAAERGTIYDRGGNKLAISISADSVYVLPPEVSKAADRKESPQKPEETALFLSRILEMDYDTILAKLNSKRSFEWIKRKADFDVAQEIVKANLPGVKIAQETQRFYPQNMLACHVLGFAGIDNQGLEGLEIAYDSQLKGINGSIIGEFDAKSREIPQADQIYQAPLDGYDLYLTVDENIQYFCERELDNLMNSENPPKRCMVLMMEPKTGAILAMAKRPGYDPNNYQDYDAADLRNSIISDSYEPGSTFKIVTSSVALEEQVITPDSRFYCSGSIKVGSHRIKCWRHYRPHGSQDFRNVIQNSCNPGFVEVGLAIEAKEEGLFYKYIKAFGFGQATDLGLSGEAAGIMIKENDLKKIDISTISIGQSISVTPIQLVTAVSAVVNGGILYKPQLVKEIRDQEDNLIQSFNPQEVRRVISQETSDTMREILESVVSIGTGKQGNIAGYRVGGKTGTAQKPGSGGYQEGKYVASFCGIAPMDDPQVVCLVIIDEPYTGSGVYQGGQVAAPVFKAIMSDTLHYLGVVAQLPESELNNDNLADDIVKGQVSVPSVINLDPVSATKALEVAGFVVKVEGSGQGIVSSQVPAGLSYVDAGSTVIIKTLDATSTETGGPITVPDLTGKRLRDVAELLGAMGLTLSAEGSGGTAYEQSPQPGEKVSNGTAIKVKFQTEEDVMAEQFTGP